MNNFKKEINFFQENGYLHVNSLVDEKIIELYKGTFFKVLKNYSKLEISECFDHDEFVKNFKLFRKKDELKLNGLFRSITKTESFRNLFSNEKVLNLLAKIFNIPVSALIVSEYQFRIDEPQDKLYTLDWHQDGTYYEQDRDGKSGIVVNICIQNCIREMGSPELVKGSHKKGKFSSKKYNKPESNSLQYNTNEKYINKNKIVVLEPKVGDVVLYDMNLIHKSGFNISNKARFSAIARAFNPLSSNFIPFYFTEKKLLKF